MKVVVASNNAGKILEYRRLLQPFGFHVLPMKDVLRSNNIEIPEEAETFEENARSKARFLFREVSGWVLGDDSGLIVDALGGLPGVRSARFANFEGKGFQRDLANINKLLGALSGFPYEKRCARFVCVIVLITPENRELIGRGICEGNILMRPQGEGGFGYDPVFLPQGFNRSMAQLSMDEKNQISHRGRAFSHLINQLGDILDSATQQDDERNPWES